MAGRLGYVVKVFPRLSETFVINEIRELERQGEKVSIFSLHAPTDTVAHHVLSDLQASVTRVDALPEPSDAECREASATLSRYLAEWPSLRDRLLPRKYVKLAIQLAHAARTVPLTRLHAHFASRATHVAMLAGLLLGRRFSFTAHAKDIYHEEVDRDVLRVKMRMADLVVTVTDYNRAALLAVGDGIEGLERKIVRSYNGVDLSLFRPAVEEKRSCRILGVGRLVEKKGFPTLIRACAMLRERGVTASCELIGSGVQEARLREMITDLGLDQIVVLRGGLPLEEVAHEIRTASVVVLPCMVASDGNVDALPTVLLEAMASGVPVVSSAISGIPEIVVEGETGHLVPPGDVVALADAIERILEDPGAADRLGRAGRRRAEQLFDLHASVARLRELLLREVGRVAVA
jgi:colanic acid/amylovoran biosynthesis glycosyltransferase